MLETIGFNPEMAWWAAAADATVGRVVLVDGGVARVLTEQGPLRASFGGRLLSEICADHLTAPCPGDWCVVREWPDSRVTLETVLPRRTSVVGSTAAGRSRGNVLCANIDYAAVVVAFHTPQLVTKLERLLTVARESGAQPLVLLAEADAVRDSDRLADLGALTSGLEVISTSIVSGAGLPRLRELIDGHLTLGLLGASVDGGTSLVNALVGARVLATQENGDDGRGMHTSVQRELVVLPSGGAVIDTQGIGGLGVINAWNAGRGRGKRRTRAT